MATKKELALLPVIFTAMNNAEQPYAMLAVKDVAGLVKDELAVQNTDISDGDKLATRLTDKGIEAVNTPVSTATATVALAGAAFGGFKVDTDIPVPTGGRGRSASGLTGFLDTIEPGASFFVPVSAEYPKPGKTLASAVSTVLSRHASPALNPDGSPVIEEYSVKGEKKTRAKQVFAKAFKVETRKEGDTEGARIWRTK